MHKPPIIFLDEPTSGVDPITRRQFWELIHQMAEEGVTVFVTTHYMEEAEYCNRLALIFRGKMVALGTPSELKRDSMKGELLLVECEPLGDGGGGAAIGAGRDGCGGLRQRAASGGARMRRQPMPQIEKFLAERGITVGRMEKIRPSLEDVFVSLTTGAMRQRSAKA